MIISRFLFILNTVTSQTKITLSPKNKNVSRKKHMLKSSSAVQKRMRIHLARVYVDVKGELSAGWDPARRCVIILLFVKVTPKVSKLLRIIFRLSTASHDIVRATVHSFFLLLWYSRSILTIFFFFWQGWWNRVKLNFASKLSLPNKEN